MTHQDSSQPILHYEGPDSIFDEITEDHFREAIQYIVKIFPSFDNYPNVEAHERALMPYDFDYRCAKRTLERYAVEVLGCDPRAMHFCYEKYSIDPSFYRDGLPRHFVSGILQQAWAKIGKTKYIRVMTMSEFEQWRH